MRKGITPVIAVVLLISITVTAAGTVYTYINAAQPSDVGDRAQFSENFKVNFESCWSDGTGYRYSIRNTGESAFNTSKVDVLINSQPKAESDYNFNQVAVNPQETFELFVDDVDRGDTLEMVKGEKTVTETCRIS